MIIDKGRQNRCCPSSHCGQNDTPDALYTATLRRFGCSPGLFYGNRHVSSVVNQYMEKMETMNHRWKLKHIKKLRKKYGNGALLIWFESVKDFAQKTCTNIFESQVPNDCNLGNAIYATDAQLHSLQVSCPVNYGEFKYPRITVITCGQEKGLYLAFCSIQMDGLRKHLKRKRLSASVLRRRYPEYLRIFKETNFAQVIRLGLIAYCPSLKDYIEMMLPNTSVIDTCVGDPKQRIAIKKIVRNTLAKSMKKVVDWIDWTAKLENEELDVDYSNCFNLVRRFCYLRYPFYKVAIDRIAEIVGEKHLGNMTVEHLKVHPTWKRFVDLKNLCMKIEGRKCAYSACSNQENRDGVIEKYKMCSSCQNAFYCSRKCQKLDWRQGHKCICNLSFKIL